MFACIWHDGLIVVHELRLQYQVMDRNKLLHLSIKMLQDCKESMLPCYFLLYKSTLIYP
jgi:hypothetical protein